MPSTKKTGLIWAIIGIVVLLALIGWRVATHNQANSAAAKMGGANRRAAPSVEVAIAKPADIVHSVNVVGTVVSPQSVDLSPKITGRITFLNVREGDMVKAGQVLVKIDPSDLQQQILQQQANVAEAKSRLAQAQLTQGSTNVGVYTNIQQQQAGLASAQADYNQTLQNYSAQVQTAQSTVSSDTSKVHAAQVQVQNANATLAQQNSNLANAQTKLQRMQTLFSQGAVAQQQRDDAQTAVEVQQQAVNVGQGQVAAAQAAVESAQADLSSAKDQLSIVKNQGRANIAAAKAKSQQAQATLKAAVSNKSQAPAYQANIDALRAAVTAAEAQYQASVVNLKETNLVSPIDGAVTARDADPGDLASPGKAVLTVQALKWVYVNTAVPMEEAANVQEGMNAQVTIDTLPGKVFTGPITNLNPSADPTSRQFTVRIRLENPGNLLKPGMYARVAVVTSSVHAAAAVPIEAVTNGKQGPTVTVVDKSAVAHVVPVVLGTTDGKQDEIKSGVNPGDQVVVLAYSPVKDGQTVSLPGSGGGGGPGGGSSGGSGRGGGRRRRQQS